MAHLRHDSSYIYSWYEVSTLWLKSMKNLKLIVKDFIKVCYRSAIFAFLNDYNNKVKPDFKLKVFLRLFRNKVM